MHRDKNKTKEKILQSAITLLTRSGFHDFGINSVAKEAGHDKVLIYRYFGGLNGLLIAITEKVEFFPDLPTFKENWASEDTNTTSTLIAYITGYVREICSRPLTLQILNWELIGDNPLTTSYKEARNQFERNLLLGLNLEDDDLHFVISILFGFLLPGFLHRLDHNKPLDTKELDELIVRLCEYLLPTTKTDKTKVKDNIRVVLKNDECDPNSLPTELL